MWKFPNPNPNFAPNFNNSSLNKINDDGFDDDDTSDDTPSFSRRVSDDIIWGYPNPNLNPNFNNSFSGKKINNDDFDDDSMSDDTPSFSRCVSYDVSGYSTADLRKLRLRFVSELDKVRNLSTRLENGSKKRPHPFATSNAVENGPNLKRFAQNRNPKASQHVMESCGPVLKKLMTQAGIWFNSPADTLGMGLHDYIPVINRPMDLGTIKEKLDKGFYATPEEFGSDVRLTFSNALLYKRNGHGVLSRQYLALFECWFKPILAKYESEKQVRKLNSLSKFPSLKLVKMVKQTTKTPIPLPPAPTAPIRIPEVIPVVAMTSIEVERSVVGEVRRRKKPDWELPKPKAKDQIKRKMSWDEKMKLGFELQNLPQEAISEVPFIVRKRNGDLIQDEDGFELDMELLDNETLWELHRYVINFNEMVSKVKRQVLRQTNNVGHTDDTIQAGVSDMMVEKSSKVKKGGGGGGNLEEKDVDIGGELHVNNFPPLDIDKDVEKQHNCSNSSGSDDSSLSNLIRDLHRGMGSDSDVDDAQSHNKESRIFAN